MLADSLCARNKLSFSRIGKMIFYHILPNSYAIGKFCQFCKIFQAQHTNQCQTEFHTAFIRQASVDRSKYRQNNIAQMAIQKEMIHKQSRVSLLQQ